MDSMPIEQMQKCEASRENFKDDTLELKFFLYWMKRAYVKVLKAYDEECAEILILITSLEMENIAVNLSEHLVVI
jgi:hypothetical protein